MDLKFLRLMKECVFLKMLIILVVNVEGIFGVGFLLVVFCFFVSLLNFFFVCECKFCYFLRILVVVFIVILIVFIVLVIFFYILFFFLIGDVVCEFVFYKGKVFFDFFC